MSWLRITAPGQLCLFGDHQSSIGLPSISTSISLRMGISARESGDQLIHVDMPEIGVRESLNLNQCTSCLLELRPLVDSANLLRSAGARWSRGYCIQIYGDIPMNSGFARTSALLAVWIRFLLEVADVPIEYDLDQIGDWIRLATSTNSSDQNIEELPYRMDGGVTISSGSAQFHSILPSGNLNGIVLGTIQEQRSIGDVVDKIRKDLREGIDRLSERIPTFAVGESAIADIDHRLKSMSPDQVRRLRASLVLRNITSEAVGAIQKGDHSLIGHLLTLSHIQLKNGYDLSSSKVDEILEKAQRVGALGGKVNGYGKSISMIVYAPGREAEVSDVIRKSGGIPFVVNPEPGLDCIWIPQAET